MSNPQPNCLWTEKVQQLCVDLERAKTLLDNAKSEVLGIEKKIIAYTGHRQEGADTNKIGGWQVTTTGKVNRTVDDTAWRANQHHFTHENSPVASKLFVRVAKLRELEEADHELYVIACRAITSRPGKPAVKIKKMEQ